MSFLKEVRHLASLATGRVPLLAVHTCSICGDVVTSISRRQFRQWEADLTFEDHPRLTHSCGGSLQPEGPPASSVYKLTGRTS